MIKKTDALDYEEEYHKKDRKKGRKERRLAQNTDTSKYKKTDTKKNKAAAYSMDPNSFRGRVLSISGEGILVRVNNTDYLCSVRGLLKKERSRSKNLIAVGDFVAVRPTAPKQGQIQYVEDRYSFLERTDVSGKKRQLLAANIDQIFITTSLVSPPLKPFLIDRYVIAAKKGNMTPIVLINKIDFLKGKGSRSNEVLKQKALYKEFLEGYKEAGIAIFSLSVQTKEGIEKLKKIMKNKASVFSGQSGVGKSSLINSTLGLNLPIGEVVTKTRKGVHTTTTAKLIPLKGGGFCIDTPGIRTFGLWDLQKEDIINHFSEIKKIGKKCKYPNCLHIGEPHCAVKEALEKGNIANIRFESYQALIEDVSEDSPYY